MIRFQVAIANTPILADNQLIAVFIDADRSPSTGPFGGFEYTIQAAGALGQAFIAHWDGSKYVLVSAPSLVKIWTSGGTMTFQISSSDLGNTSQLSFWAVSEALPESGDWDDRAPDAGFVVTYTLSTPHITSATPHFSSATPVAGRRFAVTGATLTLSTDEQVPAPNIRCRATLGGRPIRGSGKGGCSFSVPRSAHGKHLVVVISVSLDSESSTLRRTFRVR